MVKIFIIFVILILADRLIAENIHSEYASAKLLHSEINTEFIMKRIEYQPNQLINGLVYLEEIEPYLSQKGKKIRKANFYCYCGNKFGVIIQCVKNGGTKSCGCSKVGGNNIKHRLSKHPLYRVWASIKARCYNKKAIGYKNWGGRGIRVCSEWRNNFKAFYDWALVNGYEKGLEIDREDNWGDYEPLNCRFVTHAANNQNKRTTKLDWDSVYEIRNIKLLIPGITQKEISEAYNVSKMAIASILKNRAWAE